MSVSDPDRRTERMEPDRWQRRAGAAFAIRVIVFVTPIVVTVLVSVAASRVLPPPDGAAGTVVWWLMLMGISLVVLVLGMRACRRALPLAALLELSLAFPDAAPSRFKLARRISSTQQLEEELRRATEAPLGDRVSRREGRQVVLQFERAQRAESILALVAALSVHDARTRGHSERVRIFADMIGEEMSLAQADRDRLHWAALLHDIGKIEVDREILNKPAQPAPEEWEILHRHPEAGARMLRPLAPWMGPWVLAAEQHHEHWDGTGYPHGLHGEQISLAGRIVAVADAYETMTAARAYKRPLSALAAREELVRLAGNQFDPEVVRAFMNISAASLWRTVGIGALFAQLPLVGPILGALGRPGRAVPSAGTTAVALGTMTIAGFLVPAAMPLQQVAGAQTMVSPQSAARTGSGTLDTNPAPGDTTSPGSAGASGAGTAGTGGPATTGPGPGTGAAAGAVTAGASSGLGGTMAPPPPASNPGSTLPGASGFTHGRGGQPIPGQGGTPPGHAKRG